MNTISRNAGFTLILIVSLFCTNISFANGMQSESEQIEHSHENEIKQQDGEHEEGNTWEGVLFAAKLFSFSKNRLRGN